MKKATFGFALVLFMDSGQRKKLLLVLAEFNSVRTRMRTSVYMTSLAQVETHPGTAFRF